MTPKDEPLTSGVRLTRQLFHTHVYCLHSQEHSKLSKTTKRAWEKNPHDSFHVCPLVLHERIGGGNGGPVYKFVFACPGKAAALVGGYGRCLKPQPARIMFRVI